MKTIFKVGDKVYHWKYGWGIIEKFLTSINENFPILVKFNSGRESFAIDGKYNLGDPLPSLSFTEYDLVKGGFSQERPKLELPKTDTVVYLGTMFSENSQDPSWRTGFFCNLKAGKFTAYIYKEKCDLTQGEFLALENPLINPDTPIYKAEDYI